VKKKRFNPTHTHALVVKMLPFFRRYGENKKHILVEDFGEDEMCMCMLHSSIRRKRG